MNFPSTDSRPGDIAIIGMAGRFPGARNPEELWENVTRGIESISHLKVEEMEERAAGKAVNPEYVRARGILEDADKFDAAFFDIHPREAELIDPQHRVFLQTCWEALENAGRDPLRLPELTGVFAGCSQNTYFLTQVCEDAAFLQDYAANYPSSSVSTLMGAIPDTLATRVAYKLNLQGPSMAVSCACSTSLVAVSLACGSLASYQCDMALAGGVSISFPQNRGYTHQAGAMVSADGRCRSFDADASGTVFGGGAGVVVLKRLDEALRDHDPIYALIRGSAVNNDGGKKVGFTAPGVAGQARVIAMAQAVAGVEPRTIGYIEAHGTATQLGDPIEVEALTQVFREATTDTGFCALGAVKTNVGHLDIASGVTGLIKAALSLKHKQLTPTLHYRKPNPKLRLESSPFYVNTELRDWESPAGNPRRAGVSAFGLGGTNCHVILEEAPEASGGSLSRANQVLPLSAKSADALRAARQRLAGFLRSHSDVNFADVAFTLQTGRAEFPFRSVVTVRNVAEAVEALESQSLSARSAKPVPVAAPVYFLFPGQGSQYAGMGRELYLEEPRFRACVDECAEVLKPLLGVDIRQVIFTDSLADVDGRNQFNHTIYAQPAIFTVEYALANLWIYWGIRPAGMIGHSVGEFTCACIAGVMSLEDGLTLIATRAAMMGALPEGAMLAVRLSEPDLRPLLNGDVSLAAVNSPFLSVAAGPVPAIQALEEHLEGTGVAAARLRTSHAFHSAMMDPVLPGLAEAVRSIRLSTPLLPWVSCVTGDWITEGLATNPDYWANHCRETVRFVDAVHRLKGIDGSVFLEVGPGTTLQTLVRHSLPASSNVLVLSSLIDPKGQAGLGTRDLFKSLGEIWAAGGQPDWTHYYQGETRNRVSLPTYPFEGRRFWIERSGTGSTQAYPASIAGGKTEEREKMPTQGTVSSYLSRREQLVLDLTGVLQDLSGLDESLLDPRASFLELGFDSLFLTQLSQAIQSRFGVKVTFRQLLDRISSVTQVAAYLDDEMPPSKVLTAEVQHSGHALPRSVLALSEQPGAAPAGSQTARDHLMIERIINEQLQTMARLMADQLSAASGREETALKAVPVSAGPINTPTQSRNPADTRATVQPEQSAKKQALEGKTFQPFKPIEARSREELTSPQRHYLDALIARYVKRTAESKRLTQKYRRVLADPRVVSGFRSQWKEIVYPITVRRSKGSRLWDVDGNEYIDLVNGFGPIAFGHRPGFIAEALAAQLEEGIEIGPQTPLAGEVAELLCELTGMERATFCNTGSEAVMAAIRLARTVTGRSKIVLFAGDYHGNYEEVLVKRTGRDSSLRSGPIAPGITAEAVANVIVLEYGSAEALRVIREHASELAAVLVEPVQSRHPELQPREFLLELRDITDRSGTALIFDEIVTGFRVHQGGAQALYGIRADMATYGKILGGGLPIGAVAGRAAFMNALDGGMWNYGDDSYPEAGVTFFAGTFVRHPLAMASALAVLRHIKESGPTLQQDLTLRTRRVTARLNEIFSRFAVPAMIETCGSWFYWSFPNDFQFGSLFYFQLREKGIHILEGFPCFLTTAHSDADLRHLERTFEETCREMRAGGVLPELASAVKECRPRFKEAPLTESQMEIWLSSQLSVEAACAYNESISLHLRGELNQRALCDGLRQIVARHDALRVRFDPTAPDMILSDSQGLEILQVDFTSAEADRREELLGDTIKGEAETPFDLTVAPAVRAVLVRLDQTHHVLIFTAHHIVCDGWSINVILEELGEIYSAICGTGQPLSKPYSFLQYAQDLKRDASEPAMVEVERYWVTKFAEPTPALDLPVDRPRPAVKSHAGSTYGCRVDADTYRKIKSEAARHGATLTAILLAGFQALLMRLAGQDDVVVGIPSAGQSLLEGETLVGHCVNFLPLRASLVEGTTFADLLSQTRQSLLDAYEHRTYTFGTLVKRLGMKRDPSRLPLIEVQFNLERIAEGVEFTGLQVDVESNPKSSVNFDLFLNVVESRNGLVLDCDYNRDLFDRSTIERWLRHYVVLLVAACEKIEQCVAELPLLEDSERRRLTIEQNNTHAEYPRDLRIDQLVDDQAAMTPTSIAVVFEDRSLTFEQLSERSNRLARYLVRRGVQPCEKVAVLIERSLVLPESLLAVLKCGAAYVPLDPAMPRERIRTILEESNASIILMNEHAELATLSSSAARLICLDLESASIASESSKPLTREADSTATAYVIFTSGSTGKPKGVEVTHRSVVNLLWSMTAEPGIVRSDRLLAVTTLSFDIAGLEIFLPLVTGARLVIASKEATMDGFLLARCIRDFDITMLQATPSTFRLLLEAGWQPDPKVKMLCGGEAMPRQLAEMLLENGASLWNMYGPTETTIWSAVLKVSRGSGSVPIGPPIPNTQFYVLDRTGQLCPLGVAGELHIGGDGVAAGYFRRPDLTSSSFIPDPFAPSPGARMYKTGDLVRALPAGQFEFLSRLDNQVKLRGYRIELGEIESTMLQYPGVREVAVTLVQLKPGDDRLVAYVVADEIGMPAVADLRQHISGRLPGYMIPSHFIRMDKLPRTPNGKLARNALPKVDSTDIPRELEPGGPVKPDERQLSDICRQVLELKDLGIEDDLFELGADSIRIFQIAARAASAGLAITALSLLKGRNVAAACALAQAEISQAPGTMPIRVARHSRERYIVTASASR